MLSASPSYIFICPLVKFYNILWSGSRAQRAVQERPLAFDYCSSSKEGGPCNEWHSRPSPVRMMKTRRGGSTFHRGSLPFQTNTVLSDSRVRLHDSHTATCTHSRLLPEDGSDHQRGAGVQKKMEAPAGGAVRCPEVSLLSHPVLWPFHLLMPATPGAIASICSPPPINPAFTPHSPRTGRRRDRWGLVD